MAGVRRIQGRGHLGDQRHDPVGRKPTARPPQQRRQVTPDDEPGRDVRPVCHVPSLPRRPQFERYRNGMSAQPAEHDGHDVIHLGGEAAVVVPMYEYRTLKALKDRAAPDELDAAETDAAIAQYEEWVAAGRHGEMTHEEAMARLLTTQ